MNRFLFLFTLIFYIPLSFGQTILFDESFENSGPGWVAYADVTPNYWIKDVCAGNGPRVTGQKSMYVTFGGATPGCAAGGASSHAYTNADNGASKSTIIAHKINAVCASDLQISYDQLLDVDGVTDYAEMIYSTDNGATWTVIGTVLPSGAAWQTINGTLPAVLDFSEFLLGFRFTYNETVIGSKPLAIDNILVTGTDTEDPVVTCPANQNVYMNASCAGPLGNYISLALATDNCAMTTELIFSQSPAPGTSISTNTAVEIIVTDQNGNESSCSFTALAIDTIAPVIQCQEQVIVVVDSDCEFLVPDLSSFVTVTDNCTGAVDFTITQNPLAGSTASGITDVFLTVTDVAGNTRICGTRLLPNDTQAPTITCPANVTVTNGTNCSYTLLDYSASVAVVENCPSYTLFQSPAPGTGIVTGQNAVTFTVSDQLGNNGTCTFYVTVTETIPPVITACPASIATCNPLVTFPNITATDNCAVLVTQTLGLPSGSTFPTGITAMQYTARDSSGNTAVCNFNIEIYEFPATAHVTVDKIPLCETTTTTITADPITSGTGAWSKIAGAGTIANPTSLSTTVSGLSNGANTFVWTVTSVHCGSTTDTVYVNVYQKPSIAVLQSDTLYSCSAMSSLLIGNLPVIGTPKWTTLQGANIVNPNQNNSVANQLTPGWNDFIYTISSGNCPVSDDTLSIYVNKPAKIVTADTTICRDLENFTVIGAQPAFGQTPAWYFIKGQGEILTPNSTSSIVQDIANGNNLLVYRLGHKFCGFSRDTIAITVSSCNGDEFIFPTVITPNLDGKNDLFAVDNLDDLYPACDVKIINRWGAVVYESIGYKTPWNGTFKGEDLPMGTYYYKIMLNDSDNTFYSGPISIIR